MIGKILDEIAPCMGVGDIVSIINHSYQTRRRAAMLPNLYCKKSLLRQFSQVELDSETGPDPSHEHDGLMVMGIDADDAE